MMYGLMGKSGPLGLIGSLLDKDKKKPGTGTAGMGAGASLLAPKSLSGFDRPRDPLAM